MFEILAAYDKCYELIHYKLLMRKLIKRYEKKNFSGTALECHELLKKSSRSFALVILSLKHPLNHVGCIYYLTLRALDTIEDDFTIPKEKKVPMLKNFHKNLTNRTWTFLGSNDKDKEVLEKFPNISIEFLKLEKKNQAVISNICHKMGEGMAEFLQKKTISLSDWDKYCYYVAGLVGIGLSQLFVTTGFEGELVEADENLSISMGLFLQKTNIIRDVHEDLLENRVFWPSDVVSKYLETDDCQQLIQPRNLTSALHCGNELIYHSVVHVKDCLNYLSQLRIPNIFAFCAIPQVMALATLTLCYDNPDIFGRNVKISRFETVKIFNNALNMTNVRIFYRHYALKLKAKVESTYSKIQCPKARTNNRRLLDALVDILERTTIPKTNSKQDSTPILPQNKDNNDTNDNCKIVSKLPVFYSTSKVTIVLYTILGIIFTYVANFIVKVVTATHF